MDFAILENNIVKIIVGIFPTNWQQFEEVVVAHRNVHVGDEYIMGNFYRNGELIKTPEAERYEADIDEMLQALIDEV